MAPLLDTLGPKPSDHYLEHYFVPGLPCAQIVLTSFTTHEYFIASGAKTSPLLSLERSSEQTEIHVLRETGEGLPE